MAKTIQVRVDDSMKNRADALFASLGLDTSTAIRMFLTAAMEMDGLPFPIGHGINRDLAVLQAFERRKNGVPFITAKDSLANMRKVINSRKEYAK
jgi:DNA-damage-inducible protein J